MTGLIEILSVSDFRSQGGATLGFLHVSEFRSRGLRGAALVALLACATPLLARAAEPVPDQQWSRWMPSRYTGSESKASLPVPPRWWAEFGNSELDQLIAIALANNSDLQAAAARIAQAEARGRVSRAGQSPSIDAIMRAERRAPEFGIGTAPTREDYRSRRIYQAGLRVAYEVDLWGKGSYQKEAALARVKASSFARDALSLSLVSEVANTYFKVLLLRDQLLLAQTDVETAKKISAAVDRRFELGDLSLFEREQQAMVVMDAQARLYEKQQDLAAAEGDLAFLIGRPLGLLEISGQSLADLQIPDIDPGLPAALICRRPDIREVEAELEGARADISLARKGLIPTFSLTGEGGYGTSNLSDALAPQSLFTNIVGQLVQSIFDGGRKRGEIAFGKAVEQELVERYRTAILNGLRDVEEALSGVRFTQARLASLDESSNRADRLVALSLRVFERGGLDYSNLLESQRLQFRTRTQAAEARYDRLRAAVDLYKSLGGGLKFKNDTCFSGIITTAADAAQGQTPDAPDAGAAAKPLDATQRQESPKAPRKKSSRW